jgi:hypothetical protein
LTLRGKQFPTVSFLQGPYFVHIHTVHGETPNTVNTSVVRTRRYLTGREVEKLIEAARKHGRYRHRDALGLVLIIAVLGALIGLAALFGVLMSALRRGSEATFYGRGRDRCAASAARSALAFCRSIASRHCT